MEEWKKDFIQKIFSVSLKKLDIEFGTKGIVSDRTKQNLIAHPEVNLFRTTGKCSLNRAVAANFSCSNPKQGFN